MAIYLFAISIEGPHKFAGPKQDNIDKIYLFDALEIPKIDD